LLLILLIVGLGPIHPGLFGFGQKQGAASGSGPAHSAPALVAAPPASAQGAAPDHPATGLAAPASESGSADIATAPGMVTFYFATGSAGLAPGAQQALADIVRGVATGQHAIVSSYHDATGDAAANEALAQQRAQAVSEALQSLGIGDGKIELRKPQLATGSDAANQARRVEVTLQ
jgi:outer membrane protein OmpA-like peptidoglycan-associated protein